MEQMYSLKTAADLLDVSPGDIRSLGQKAGISFYVIGDSTRISESGLSALVNYSGIQDHCIAQMYSLEKAAEVLDISTRTLRRLIKFKNLPTYRVGSNIRLKQQDLAKLVERQLSLDDY